MLELNKKLVENKTIVDRYGNPIVSGGYGSGFKKQIGYDDGKSPMKDFFFGVEDTEKFHFENLANNPGDYSKFAQILGLSIINLLQNIGPKIYYNSHIKIGDETIKYGIISIKDMISDLLNWDSLYIAGRLQKPVDLFSYNEEFEKAYIKNLQNAFNVALLLLGEKFTLEDLFKTITSISYMGDIRMKLNCENPEKISNIVKKNIEGFSQLYYEIISKNNFSSRNGADSEYYSQEKSIDNINIILENLPPNLKKILDKNINYIDISNQKELSELIKASISHIVGYNSIVQSAKGAFTSGSPLKYLSEKKAKSKSYSYKSEV